MALLVPYNEAMRLGMGFNTFTQQLCIDGAVKITRSHNQPQSNGTILVNNPSQTVTYSSRIVEKLSDIVETLNISYSAAIKKGTIEVSGNSSTIDEDKIKSSDLSAIVSVKVQNQMTLMSESSKFESIKDVAPNSQRFNEIFGDGYISGFIEGGEFTGVVSVRVLERTDARINQVASQLKKSLGKGTKSINTDSFTLDSFDITESGAGQARSALQGSETTVSVSWNGGGQVKDHLKPWNIDTMFEAAAAFPANVAASPQRTWAIITKYPNNRAYVEWEESQGNKFSPLEYDNINSFSAELFDNYFQYKQLVKLIQAVIADTSLWEVRKDEKSRPKPIPLDLRTLVAVRSALRNEMNKIVEAVDVLTRDPGILKRNRHKLKQPKSEFVKDFLMAARDEEPSDLTDLIADAILLSLISPDLPPASDHTSKDTHTTDTVGHEPEIISMSDAKAAGSAHSSSSNDKSSDVTTIAPRAELYFDFDSLIAPEIWMEAMPKRKESGQSVIGETISGPSATGGLPAIPSLPNASDERAQFLREQMDNGGQFVSDLQLEEYRAAKQERDELKASNKTLAQEVEHQTDAVSRLATKLDQSETTIKEKENVIKEFAATIKSRDAHVSLLSTEIEKRDESLRMTFEKLERVKQAADYIVTTRNSVGVKESYPLNSHYADYIHKFDDFRLSPVCGDPVGGLDRYDYMFNWVEHANKEIETLKNVEVFSNATHLTGFVFAYAKRDSADFGRTTNLDTRSGDCSRDVPVWKGGIKRVRIVATKCSQYERLVISEIEFWFADRSSSKIIACNTDGLSSVARDPTKDMEIVLEPPVDTWSVHGLWGIKSNDGYAFHKLGVVWRVDELE